MLIKKSIPLLFSLFLFLSPVDTVRAVTVSQIEIIPSSPVVNDQFECVFTVDFDESNLACGLLGINDPDTKKPWDICPKTGNLGHRYTAGSKRHYNCVAGAQTGVPGPGRYRIVAWRFYADGAYGDVVSSKEVSVLSQPPPTATPLPTQKPTPAPTHVLVPTVNNVIPTLFTQPSVSQNPTQELFPTQGVHPTISFSQVRGGVPPPQRGSRPDVGMFPSLLPPSLIAYTQLVTQKIISLSAETISYTRNFFIIIVTNFFSETSF